MQHSVAEDILTIGEEIANSITHGLGLLLSIAGLVVLVVFAALRGNAWHVASCSIYGATLVLLYLSSTLYHAFTGPRVKRIFRIFDHSAIFLLIAGTYTPFLLLGLRNWFGYTLLAIVWTGSIGGVVFKSIIPDQHGVVSTLIYTVLGWVGILAVRPMSHVLPMSGLLWIVAGGLFYTAGIIFFASRWRYAHTIWHLFVLGGSACHYAAILVYLVLRKQ